MAYGARSNPSPMVTAPIEANPPAIPPYHLVPVVSQVSASSQGFLTAPDSRSLLSCIHSVRRIAEILVSAPTRAKPATGHGRACRLAVGWRSTAISEMWAPASGQANYSGSQWLSGPDTTLQVRSADVAERDRDLRIQFVRGKQAGRHPLALAIPRMRPWSDAAPESTE